MEKRPINPWTWQTPYNFSQAWKIDKCQSMVFVSGQASLATGRRVLERSAPCQHTCTLRQGGTAFHGPRRPAQVG